MKEKNDEAVLLVRSDDLLAALFDYRCQYTRDGNDGDHLPLVDALSPGQTIKEGRRELELLAEHIYLALVDANEQDRGHSPPKENL
jgi:hypothetical protein